MIDKRFILGFGKVFSTQRSANSHIRCENVDCLSRPKIDFFRIKVAATICFCFCFGLGFRTENRKQIGVLRLFHGPFSDISTKCFSVTKSVFDFDSRWFEVLLYTLGCFAVVSR